MPQATGATLIARTLADAGVSCIFTVSGNQVLDVFDACLDVGIKLIHTRHEAAAGHMADAWGRLTGAPGVYLVSGGPAHCNGAVAAGIAGAAESPVLWLSGSGPLADRGRGGFQELDQVGLAATVCKAAWEATDAHTLPQLMADALALASADPPGPVHVTLPVDVQSQGVESDQVTTPDRSSGDAGAPDDVGDAAAILNLLAEAQRPLVLARTSFGRAAARRDLDAFLAQTGIPGAVVESPRGLHDPAQPGLVTAVGQADALLLVAPADFAVGFASPSVLASDCTVAQVVGAGEPVAPTAKVVMRVGAQEGLRRLAAVAGERTWARHTWWQPRVPTDPRDEPSATGGGEGAGEGIHPFALCQAVLSPLGSDDCVALDGGEFGQWARLAAGAAGAAGPTVVLNGKFGPLGPGVPFAVAARLARPQARAVAFCGDGGAGYQLMELDTAQRYDLPVLVVVGNDARWGSEWHLQVERYGQDRTVATDLLPTRYDQVAAALGAHGECVTDEAALPAAVQRAYRALADGRSVLLNARITGLRGPAPSP